MQNKIKIKEILINGENYSDIKNSIESNTKTLINEDTGEIYKMKSETDYGSSKHFAKFYPKSFSECLGNCKSSELKIICEILSNFHPTNNIYINTYDKIMEATNLSRQTVANVMLMLQKSDFIRPIQNGVWMLNPQILVKGGEEKKIKLCTLFYELKKKI